MSADPLTISLETVIAASTLLGHPLEDRARVRDGQQPDLVDAFRRAAVPSGKGSRKTPRHNHLVHEKLLYVEALKRGFEQTGRPAHVLTMPQLEEDPDAVRADRPTVVLGYIKDLLNHLGLRRDGRLTLFGRTVDAAINDRFCLNVVSRFGHQVDMTRFLTLNRCFMVGADKGVTYEL